MRLSFSFEIDDRATGNNVWGRGKIKKKNKKITLGTQEAEYILIEG